MNQNTVGFFSVAAIALRCVSGTAGTWYWCEAPEMPIGGWAVSQLSAEFRGEFRDLSMWIESAPGVVGGCKEFDQYKNNNLLVIEFDSDAVLEQELGNIVKITPVLAQEKLSIVVARGTVLDEDWATNEGVHIFPVSPTSVLPQRPLIGRISQPPSSTREPAVAQLVASVSEQSIIDFLNKLQSFYTRNSFSQEVKEAQQNISATASALGLKMSAMPFREDMSSNVIGELRGSEFPDEVIVIGSHYDCRSTRLNDPSQRAPGADDNGSGSAAVMELARVLAASGQKLKRTVRFVWFAGEEQGLYGSYEMSAQYAASGVNVVAMLNADMLGWQVPGTPMTVGFNNRYITGELVEVARAMIQTYVPELGADWSSACCSDYIGFYQQGYPAMSFLENADRRGYAAYPHYHKSTDLLENVNTKQVATITQAILATALYVAELATDEFMI